MLKIFIGSENDKEFLTEGLNYLKNKGINNEIVVSSVHRNPTMMPTIVKKIKEQKDKVIIAGAASATGLPGVLSGYLLDTNVVVLGVRFSKESCPNIIEDATFNLSSMPKNVPLAYLGYNEKGFLHACILSSKILKNNN